MTGLENILVVDLETSGLDPRRHGILEIAVVPLVSGDKVFFRQYRLRPGREIDSEALGINGSTIADCYDLSRKDEGEGLVELINWCHIHYPDCYRKLILAGMNPGRFDLAFLDWLAVLEGINGDPLLELFPFAFRTLDMHSLAIGWAVAHGVLIPPGGFRTDEIYAMLGMPPEPKPHGALTGAQMEAAAFRLLLGVE